MFAYTRTERRLLGFDAGDWSIIVLSLALIASLTLLLQSSSRNRHHRARRVARRGIHNNRPTLRGSNKPRQATTSSKIRDATFIAPLDIGIVAG
jgi:hypothetical protein